MIGEHGATLQIVFPEAHWIGTKDENPSEQQLLMPAELQSAVQHTKYSFATDASQLGALQCSDHVTDHTVHALQITMTIADDAITCICKLHVSV